VFDLGLRKAPPPQITSRATSKLRSAQVLLISFISYMKVMNLTKSNETVIDDDQESKKIKEFTYV